MMNKKNKCKNCARYFRDTHNLCVLAEMDEVNAETDACENFEKYYNRNESAENVKRRHKSK